MALVSQEIISDLYTVYCGRSADPEGLAFWHERLSGFDCKEEAVRYFGRSSDMGQASTATESKALDPQNFEEVMSCLLIRTYGREATSRERGYYLAQLESGSWEPIELAWALMNQAEGSDCKALESKLAPARQELKRRQEQADPKFIAQQTLSQPILIAAHHKAGTNWLSSIFHSICDRFNFRMLEGESPDNSESFDVFLQDHSVFKESLLSENFRGVHMIRDPRDVIISGCFYHQKADESWLKIKRKRYGGLSYQEKLNSFDSFSDKLLFEMEGISLITIKDMWAWNYAQASFHEVKYEDLIHDTDLQHFQQMFASLGIGQEALMPHLLEVARDNSLFSGKVASTHVRSGSARQWPQYLDAKLKRRFLELFGDVLIDLAYEEDHAWAELETPLPNVRPACAGRTIMDILYHPDDSDYEEPDRNEWPIKYSS